jgi:hypothetical protein
MEKATDDHKKYVSIPLQSAWCHKNTFLADALPPRDLASNRGRPVARYARMGFIKIIAVIC